MTKPQVLLFGSFAAAAEKAVAEALRPAYRVLRPPGSRAADPPTTPGDRPAGDGLPRALAETEPDAVLLLCASSSRETFEPLLRSVRETAPGVPVLAAVEVGSPREVIELLRCGADDFVTAPVRAIELLPRLWRLVAPRRKREELVRRLEEKLGLRHLVGRSPAFLGAVERIPRMARCDATVLIGGETGTGKELCARAVHYLSRRARSPFIAVNCGAIPLELVENELFGHQRAAYTGAETARHGLVREAESGTLFLDEIDALPPPAQVKLLRFLQEKEYRPLGSTRVRRADVRLVAATNADLEETVRRGELRRDLYYRLSVLPLHLPPLRQRREDIPLLAHHFLGRFSAEHRRPAPTLTAEAVQALLLYDWPGNVRELEHMMERAVVLADDRRLVRAADLFFANGEAAEPESFKRAKARAVADFERSYLESLLLAHRGNITHAARAARKNRRAFWELMRKHAIDARPFRTPGAGTESADLPGQDISTPG